MKHFLSIEQPGHAEIAEIFKLAHQLKASRGKTLKDLPLKNRIWALIFSKSSTRTRVSFEVGVRELGGTSLYLSATDIQLGRGETVADTARTLSRYINGGIIRTFAQHDLDEFAKFGSIPVINALTDDEHPCQILADLFTINEKLGTPRGKKVPFVGVGAGNVANPWMFAAAKTGIELWVAAPKAFQPPAALLKRAGGTIHVTDDVVEAAKNADVLDPDVWVAMGKEAESAQRAKTLAGYQINADVVRAAKPQALVMHCLPASVGKEIAADVFEAHQQTIFDQAENRLHVQKAILTMLAREWKM